MDEQDAAAAAGAYFDLFIGDDLRLDGVDPEEIARQREGHIRHALIKFRRGERDAREDASS